MSEILKNFTVIDLSHRLPGPLCGKILQNQGAKVIKIEDIQFKDPFLSGLFSNFDESFIEWYKNLNSGKDILRFDFTDENDQLKIQALVKSADAVIMGLPHKTRIKLKLDDSNLNYKRPFVVIELLASKQEQKSMHDLNALASSGLLKLFVAEHNEKIVQPPFLPIAGISFGHKAATDLLASYITSSQQGETIFCKTYLDEVTKDLLGMFWPSLDRDNNKTKFLHNGLYPCYCLYQTKDKQYVALAAVEDKFWIRFCEIFNIDSKENRFFNENDKVFKIISDSITSYSLDEIEQLTYKEDICLSIIR